MSKTINLIVKSKISPFSERIKVDSDKSLSIRSFLIGAIIQNKSYVKNVLESEDVISTIKCLKKLKVKLEKLNQKLYNLWERIGSLQASKNLKLNFGNSGTLARLLIGILSTKNVEIIMSGDRSLNKRNMKKLIDLMSQFGATFLPKKIHLTLENDFFDDASRNLLQSRSICSIEKCCNISWLNSFGNTIIEERSKQKSYRKYFKKK